nr:hypothetical protein [Tanacetum cinerariifolium]
STENGVNPPAPNPSHKSNFSLLSVLGRERLIGPKYMDWMRNLRFTLRYGNKEYVLDEQIPTIHDDSTQEEIKAHHKHYDDANKKGKAAKGKSDRWSKRKAKSEIAPTSDLKKVLCFYCNIKRHWKRSCLKYSKDVKDGKVENGTHLGLKESRMLKHGELNLVMGHRKITHDNVVFVARRRVFLGREMIPKEDSGSKIYLKEIQESVDEEPIVNTDTQREVVTPVEPDDIPLPISKTSGKVSKPPQFYYGFHIEEDKISDSTLSELDEPANYKEAMASLEAAKWKEAMKSKIQSMIMFTIVAFHDYEIWKMDVNTAFLNEKLTKDVFMAQLEGFKNATYPKRVCKLQKAIYGLKQAFHSWNICFLEKVTQFGFSRSEDESCIYIKVSGSVVVFMVLYVDDILLIGNNITTLQSVKDWLGKCFAMKDLGDAAYILDSKMENSKKHNLPLHHGIKISKDLCSKTDKELDIMSRVPHASAIGSIMYAMTCIRPDVSFALSMMKNYIGDLEVVPIVQDPIEIFYDNESAVALTKEPKDHGKLKHIEKNTILFEAK